MLFLCCSTRVLSLPFHCFAVHRRATQFLRDSLPSFSSAFHRSSLPYRGGAGQGISEPLRFFALLVHAIACQVSSLPLRCCAVLIYSVAVLIQSMLIQSIAAQCCTMPLLCITFQIHSHAQLCDTVAFPGIANQCLCIALYINAMPSPFRLRGAFPLLYIALRVNAILGYSVACQPLLPPMTFPASSSSSQRNLPIPLFRHWPMPEYLP